MIDAKKMWSKDDFSIASAEGLRKKASITESWSIVTDPDVTIIDLSNEASVPQIGDVYPGLQTIFVKDKQWERVSPIYWILTVQYEGEFGPDGADQRAEFQPPVISWTDTETEEAIDEDLNGAAIVNVNNEPIEGVTMKIADLVLTVERKYRFFDPVATHAYRHSVNSDTFAGFAPGTGRLTAFSANQEYDENQNGYWKVNASIQFRYPYRTTAARAWWKRILHEGYMVRASALDPPEAAYREVDGRKEQVTKPVLLKADGTRENDPANAVFLEFEVYTPLPYNSLGLLS